MRKIFILILMILLVTGCSFSSAFIRENEKIEYLSGKHNIEMKIKKYGTIKLELDADVAPITVTNFINLVESKFYDNLTFHRIMSGFMIQGGDPRGDGTGGSSQNIKGEFIANGVVNDIEHKRGVISMARAENNYDSASSQFFIMHKDNEGLDGYYAAFGHVTEGMNVVDKLAKIKSDSDTGYVERELQPVIEYIKVID